MIVRPTAVAVASRGHGPGGAGEPAAEAAPAGGVVELHVERLIVDRALLAPRQRARFGAALQRALEHGLAAPAAPFAARDDAELRVPLRRGRGGAAAPADLAREIAAALLGIAAPAAGSGVES